MTWQKRITNQLLCSRIPRISTIIRERCLRFSGYCWRRKNEVVSDLVLWEPKHGERSGGGQAGTVVSLLEADTGVPRDCLPAAMDDRVGWRKKASGGGGRGEGGGGGMRRATEVDLVVVAVVQAGKDALKILRGRPGRHFILSGGHLLFCVNLTSYKFYPDSFYTK